MTRMDRHWTDMQLRARKLEREREKKRKKLEAAKMRRVAMEVSDVPMQP